MVADGIVTDDMYSNAELLADLRRLADDLGRAPRVRDVQEHGKHSHTLYYDRFGSWSETLEAAGLETDEQDTRHSKKELLEEIRRLADDIGETPTIAELRERGEYSIKPYVDRFGSWNSAVEAAGLESRSSTRSVSESDLIADLQRVATDSEGVPTAEDVRERGNHAPSTYIERFGSWRDARKAAGVPVDIEKNEISEQELLDEVRRLGDELGQPPTVQDIREQGRFSRPTYYSTFDSWSDVLAAAGYDLSEQQHRISDEELCEELDRLATELGDTPTLQDLREKGKHSATTYIDRFGSWQAALEAAGYEPREPTTEIRKDDLLTELQDVAQELGERPTAPQMNEHGEYWASTYRRRFDSWSAALEAAGFDDVPTRGRVSEEDLLEELRRLADELGERPTMSTMREEGKYSTSTYARRFGSWSDAIDASDVDEF